MSSGNTPPERSRKSARKPKKPDDTCPVLIKPNDCPPDPKPPDGTSVTGLRMPSGIRLGSAARQKSGKRLGSGRPYQQHLLGPLPQLESKPLISRSQLKTGCYVDLLPHIPANVQKNSTDDRPRTANIRSTVENLPECVNNPFGSGRTYERARTLPLTPKEALKMYRDKLTPFEQEEISNFLEIWYLGLDARKIEAVEGAPQNHGFDDENGTYIKVMHDHIQYRYEVLEVIGKGSFGQVLKCLDHKTKELVALKILRNKKRFHHQSQVELSILELLNKKDRSNRYNIIHMKEHFMFRDHLCITFDLQGKNLFEVIKKNRYQGFRQTTVRRFTHSILKCLQMLHRERIIHCDLKPENIVLTQKGSHNIKVIDFGSSCLDHQRVYTYIQSRFYRSPEVILGSSYGLEIDMWSLGCIIAELYTGLPLFPGENERDQIACIMEVLGVPPAELLKTASRRKKYFDSRGNPKPFTNSKGKCRKPDSKDLSSVLRSSDPLFLDFLKGCLAWDPKKRMTPDDAMQHDWIQDAIIRCVTRTRPSRKMTEDHSAYRSEAPLQKSPDKHQDNTSIKENTHSTGKTIKVLPSPPKVSEVSPKHLAEMSAKQAAGRSSKLAPGRSLKQGVTRSPKQATETFPKQGVTRSPKEGVTKCPMQATETSPKQGVTKSPKHGTETSPKQGVTRSPKEGVTKSPKQATETSLKQGVTKSPKQATETSPKQAAEMSPKYGTEKAPNQVAETSLKYGTAKSPKQAAERSNKQVANKSPSQGSAKKFPSQGSAKSPKQGSEKAERQSPGRGKLSSPERHSPSGASVGKDAVEATNKDPRSGGSRCEVAKLKPAQIMISPPVDTRTLTLRLHLDQSQVWDRLN